MKNKDHIPFYAWPIIYGLAIVEVVFYKIISTWKNLN